ncbi:MAG: aspartate--tRNA ligase [Acidimicrobiia bacterium]|nr:aspartate--tRNA ligase [Acidimicrobiia bacterium]MYC58365.1 aspartate--tRNA ligase [Acidimicrobiia bacterium]MYI30529.1 aspartate--tRNA ligase [Acidimicrobiia bacterium]
MTVLRTDYCGELGVGDVGREVVVSGWVDRRREHGDHLAFIDLRDRSGVVQCVVDERHDLRSEYVVRICGKIRPRPEGTVNPNLLTGEIEVGDCTVEVLSTAEPLPFPLHARTEVDENVRLRYRYVDLRTERLQHNLELRAKVNSAIRKAMEAQRFTEIETPMLVASTPEGARDFVVPARLHPGHFYALPQSPQIFKQLCMVGGIDRYYQIARCLRDEDLRADRQFEFMQLDVEASFVGQDEIMVFISEAVGAAVAAVTGTVPPEPIYMSWTEAMERYGSDKPDVRFGLELVELTGLFADTTAKVFQVECVKGINYTGGSKSLGRNAIDELTRKCQQWGAKGLAWFRVGDDGALEGALTKFMSVQEQAALGLAMDAKPGDLLLLIADSRRKARAILGLLRLELGRPPINEGGLNFVWVTDFPLFEAIDDQGHPVAAHHPFTMPHLDDVALLDGAAEELLAVRSQAYDLVLNGWELGSGSVRIHRMDIQRAVFRALGISDEEAEQRFGFLLDAFRYGAPPHAGFAFGIDRLVAILAGEENIREVIAFPKTQSGADPLSNSPTVISDRHLDELGLRIKFADSARRLEL